MTKEIQKFVPVVEGKLGMPIALLDLVGNSNKADMYLQAIGIKDADKEEIYEGDVLELRITDELMDPNKNMFYNSNLGKAMSKDRSITSVICVIRSDNDKLQCGYKVYFANKDGVILDEDEPDVQATGYEVLFPSYLCEKGARIIGNIVNNSDILLNFNKYSYWNKSIAIEVTTVNCDGKEVEHSWESPIRFRSDWLSTDCSAPMLDDKIISAKVCGVKVESVTFLDVVDYIDNVTSYKLL